MIIWTWAFGRCCLRNEPSEPVMSRKTADSSCTNDEIEFSRENYNLENLHPPLWA